MFDAKLATDKTFERSRKGDAEELRKAALSALADDFGEELEDTAKKDRRRSLLDKEDSEEESEPASESEAESDYWGGLGTPSELSEDGREQYENWKAEKAEKEAKDTFQKEQSELERAEIMRLEEELEGWEDKLDYRYSGVGIFRFSPVVQEIVLCTAMYHHRGKTTPIL